MKFSTMRGLLATGFALLIALGLGEIGKARKNGSRVTDRDKIFDRHQRQWNKPINRLETLVREGKSFLPRN